MITLNKSTTPPLPKSEHDRLQWGNLAGSSLSLAIHNATLHKSPALIIVPENLSVITLKNELEYLTEKESSRKILTLTDWETLPYDRFSPHQDITSERLKTLSEIDHSDNTIVITSITTLMQTLSPKEFINQYTFFVDVGDEINLDTIRTQFVRSGYRNVGQVFEHGEFAIRGSILDIFPMGCKLPFRIELFDNEIETIRTFDSTTQRSINEVNSIHLLPAKEFPTDENAITRFRTAFRESFEGNPTQCPVYTNVTDGIFTPGIEYYLPLFVEHTETLFDFLHEDTLIITTHDTHTAADTFWTDILSRHEQRRHDVTHPVLPPESLFIPPNTLREKINAFARVNVHTETIEENAAGGKFNFATQHLPDIVINQKLTPALQSLQGYLATNKNQRFLFCANSAGRRETLLGLLREIDTLPKTIKNWNEFHESTDKLCITISPLETGFFLSDLKLSIITEADIFGERTMQTRRRKRSELATDPDQAIFNLAELNTGDPVVHAEHGVARYQGLETITLNNQTNEFLTLLYANEDKLYVPITSLHLITSYSGATVENAPINRLGSQQWNKAKQKAAKRIHDIAAELLAIYAKRAAKKGFAFSGPDKQYQQFSALFPFEETPDQEKVISDIIADMRKTTPMDRLVCGDVGFGKTEVAMRAAFLAVNSTKQVCILVPTTLLAKQHFETLQDRFADFPVQIDMLSRFKSNKEQQQTIAGLKTGHVDIVVGTHKLIQESIAFKDLGLIIIDEEHRFGVKQKEHLKALRSEVDILTLTATPIPRTLNMALSDIRDLSIIATPPAKRLSIKTFVHEHEPALIQESIEREILRGGQVYFLHNDVSSINLMADKLRELVPSAKVDVGHGQMRESNLEKIMADFYHHRFNVLVCSTIIETGIDIPSANTIIINRADKFGLAQLHQLRGRVGRSHHQAYAYMLIPSHNALTGDAQKRLTAISEHEDLGMGFTLAMHDLEIRGAGELLGGEQSGNIHEIGYSLYNEMLERAVHSIKDGKEIDLVKPLAVTTDINLQITALIPETFVPDVHTRLQYYKRIANAKTESALDDVMAEMIDCFGLLPNELKHLFAITELKLTALTLGIGKIEMHAQGGRFEFSDKPNINPAKLISLIQTEPDTYQLIGPTKLRFSGDCPLPAEKFELIESIFTALS